MREGEERHTAISAYGCSGNAARRVCSSSAAVRGSGCWDPRRSDNCCEPDGMPVMGSRRVLRCAMVHEGEMRRSDEELGDTIWRGTSGALWRAMVEN